MTLWKRALAEFLGTAGLLIVVVGSGIMAERLAQGNDAIALLANSVATGAGLFALIQTFGHISGSHFNPAVSLIELLWKRLSPRGFVVYVLSQVAGAVIGVWTTHAMFGLNIVQLSTHNRRDARFLLSEAIATLGLLLVIARSGRKHVEATPFAVASYITAAYWCTSSTSFANPAVTIARCMTNTFSGILWTGAPGFIAAQFVGTLAAYILTRMIDDDTSSSA